MQLDYWGASFPRSDTVQGPGRAMMVFNMGPMNLVHAGSQSLSTSDSTTVTLTIPTDALYAKVQFHGAAWYSTNGTVPTIATKDGFKQADLTTVELFGYDQMSKFKVRADTGVTGKIFVEYKKHAKTNQA